VEVALTLIGVVALALWWRGREKVPLPGDDPSTWSPEVPPDGKTGGITDDPVTVGGQDVEAVNKAIAAADSPPPSGSLQLPPSATDYTTEMVLDRANEADAVASSPEPFKPGLDSLTAMTGVFNAPTLTESGAEKSKSVPGNSWDPLTLSADQAYEPESIGGDLVEAPVVVE